MPRQYLATSHSQNGSAALAPSALRAALERSIAFPSAGFLPFPADRAHASVEGVRAYLGRAVHPPRAVRPFFYSVANVSEGDCRRFSEGLKTRNVSAGVGVIHGPELGDTACEIHGSQNLESFPPSGAKT